MNIIVDDIGLVVAAVREKWITADSTLITADSTRITADGGSAPYYAFGHVTEIVRGLTEKDQNKSLKFKKYPLVALMMDFPEEKSNGIINATLNIVLLEFTKTKYNASERYDETFRKVLYPLYEKFMEEIRNSGLFFWDGEQEMPEHTKYDRPYWGTQQSGKGNTKNILNDPIDAIEIQNLKVSQKIKC